MSDFTTITAETATDISGTERGTGSKRFNRSWNSQLFRESDLDDRAREELTTASEVFIVKTSAKRWLRRLGPRWTTIAPRRPTVDATAVTRDAVRSTSHGHSRTVTDKTPKEISVSSGSSSGSKSRTISTNRRVAPSGSPSSTTAGVYEGSRKDCKACISARASAFWHAFTLGPESKDVWRCRTKLASATLSYSILPPASAGCTKKKVSGKQGAHSVLHAVRYVQYSTCTDQGHRYTVLERLTQKEDPRITALKISDKTLLFKNMASLPIPVLNNEREGVLQDDTRKPKSGRPRGSGSLSISQGSSYQASDDLMAFSSGSCATSLTGQADSQPMVVRDCETCRKIVEVAGKDWHMISLGEHAGIWACRLLQTRNGDFEWTLLPPANLIRTMEGQKVDESIAKGSKGVHITHHVIVFRRVAPQFMQNDSRFSAYQSGLSTVEHQFYRKCDSRLKGLDENETTCLQGFMAELYRNFASSEGHGQRKTQVPPLKRVIARAIE